MASFDESCEPTGTADFKASCLPITEIVTVNPPENPTTSIDRGVVQARVICVAEHADDLAELRSYVALEGAVVRSAKQNGGDITHDTGAEISTASYCAAVLTPEGAPRINRFVAMPPAIALGDDALLEWDVEVDEDTVLTIDQGVGDVTGVSQTRVRPTTTTTFTLRATNDHGSSTSLVRVIVNNPTEPPVIDFFIASGQPAPPGSARKLHWCYRGGTGTTGTIDQGIGTLDTNTGSVEVRPTATTTYTLTVSNAHGADATSEAKVAVAPVIHGFDSDADTANAGSRISLSWQINEGDVSLDNDIGDVESLEGVRERSLPTSWAERTGWGALVADDTDLIGYDHESGFRAIDQTTGDWTGDALKDPISDFGEQDEGQSKPWSIAVLEDGYVAVNLEGDFFQVRDATSEFEMWSDGFRLIAIRGITVLGDRLWAVTSTVTDVDFYYCDVSELDSLPTNNRLEMTKATNVATWPSLNLNRIAECWTEGSNIRLLVREAGGYWRVMEAAVTDTSVTAHSEVQYLRRHDAPHGFTSAAQIGNTLYAMTNGIGEVNPLVMKFSLDEPVSVGTAKFTLNQNTIFTLTVTNDDGSVSSAQKSVYLTGMAPVAPEAPDYDPTVNEIRALPSWPVVPPGTAGQIAWRTTDALAVRVYKTRTGGTRADVYDGPVLTGWSTADFAAGDLYIHVVGRRGTDTDAQHAEWIAGDPTSHPPPLVRKFVYEALALDGASLSDRFWPMAAATDQDIAEGRWAQYIRAVINVLNTRGQLFPIEFFLTGSPLSDLRIPIHSRNGGTQEVPIGSGTTVVHEVQAIPSDLQHDDLQIVPNALVHNSVAGQRYVRWQYMGIRTRWASDSDWHTVYFRIFEDPE